ncbi:MULTISPECIES: hypothetical protein [unclassified Sphingopyxis]|uniref:hypothetical protein n=1 Tax=unclassified Sphingopyxis TaxID=2614943 RepID=UPI0024AC8617|nr:MULTISPECIES: hypothetical protein [unclassified Sphingopyxis]
MSIRVTGYALISSAALIAGAQAEKAPEADPARYVAAFTTMCRDRFPDVDAVARNATLNGWNETTPRLISGTAPVQMPRVFIKDGLMLTTTNGSSPVYSATCQITGSANTSLSGADVAAILSPAITMGEPQLGPGNPKQNDFARWTQSGGIVVEAGIAVYHKRVRTISISIRKAR